MKEAWKVYIKGVPNRGNDVVKILQQHGGKQIRPGAISGDNDAAIYYIDHDGIIRFATVDKEVAQIIMDYYKEIKLPEQWKDGDILFSETDNEFVVFKCEYKISSVNADKFISYLATCFGGCLIHQTILRKDFRLATKSEVAQFHERLHAIEKDWDAEKKQFVDWKWKPKDGEVYWVISSDGDVETYTWYDYPEDKGLFNFGNCFKTLEEAKTMAEKVRKLLKGEL